MSRIDQALKQLGKWEYYDVETGENWTALQMIYEDGTSIKGTLVEPGSLFNSVHPITANDPDPVGVIVEDGKTTGELVWVAIKGNVKVLLQDSTSATAGYWVRASATQNGRADARNAAPPGAGISEIDIHLKECGHCLETVTAGVNQLALVHIHFN